MWLDPSKRESNEERSFLDTTHKAGSDDYLEVMTA